MKNTTIGVIGGTGKSGRYVTNYLLECGYSLQMLLRDPSKFTLAAGSDSINIVQGNARNEEDILRLVAGCDIIISTLGQPAGEPSVFSTATSNIIRAARQYPFKRYIVTTGLSVDCPGDAKSADIAAATGWMYEHYPETTADKQLEYELLSESALEWTMVRLPLILMEQDPLPVATSLTDCGSGSIRAGDLARFIKEELENPKFRYCAPFLYNI